MSEEAVRIVRAFIAREEIEARLVSREVFDAHGELDGYALYDKASPVALTPVRDCRCCAWADAKAVVYATDSHALEYHSWVRWE